ncbi:MAG TPA: HEPN domain-containing protein [Thermoguttaceae bacterium]|nr:HEPN domain-containing protein [Thermoguttaceae bacterium]HPP52473.1 HEPN domain-containing protein [Thermoguttaceae bacterium]
MSFDWREFLALAKALQQSPHPTYSTEAAQRVAVSRAYYAAFCYLRNYAETHLGLQRKRTGEDHALLRKHLRKLGNPWDQRAEKLEELLQWRHQCDYDDVVGDLNIKTSTAITTAEDLINACP